MTKSNIEYTEEEKTLHAVHFLVGEFIDHLSQEKWKLIGKKDKLKISKAIILLQRWALINSKKKGIYEKYVDENLFKTIGDFIHERTKIMEEKRMNHIDTGSKVLTTTQNDIIFGEKYNG